MTEAKELPKEAPERGSFPRWPTNIIDIICKLYCSKLTAIRGPASHSCFLASSTTSSLRQQPRWSHVWASSSWFPCWFGHSGVSRFDLPAVSIISTQQQEDKTFHSPHHQIYLYLCVYVFFINQSIIITYLIVRPVLPQSFYIYINPMKLTSYDI